MQNAAKRCIATQPRRYPRTRAAVLTRGRQDLRRRSHRRVENGPKEERPSSARFSPLTQGQGWRRWQRERRLTRWHCVAHRWRTARAATRQSRSARHRRRSPSEAGSLSLGTAVGHPGPRRWSPSRRRMPGAFMTSRPGSWARSRWLRGSLTKGTRRVPTPLREIRRDDVSLAALVDELVPATLPAAMTLGDVVVSPLFQIVVV